jgi:hypothetical protein
MEQIEVIKKTEARERHSEDVEASVVRERRGRAEREGGREGGWDSGLKSMDQPTLPSLTCTPHHTHPSSQSQHNNIMWACPQGVEHLLCL